MFISFSGSGSTSGLELYTKYSVSSPIKFRHRIDSNRIDGAWRTLIDSSSIGSQTVASASKLTTARSIWGQSFDGSKDISGDMRNVGTLYFSNTTEAHIGYNNTYTDPYVNLSVNFKLGGTVAAKTIYSNGGFVKSGSSNDYVLLGGGSHSKISSLSVGNADTVDGAHLNGIFTAFGNNGHNITATIGGVTKQFVPNWAADSDKLDGYHVNNGNTWNSIPVIKSDGVMEVGKYIDFHYNTTNYDYSTRLQVQGNYSNVVNLPTASGTLALTSDLPMKYYA